MGDKKSIFSNLDLQASAKRFAYAVYYFKSKDYYSEYFKVKPNETLISASVIKSFVMEYAFHERDLGHLDFRMTIDGQTVYDWLEAMIQVSDNLAANTLIRYFGMPTLNRYFQSRGYHQTKLERLMLDNVARASGLDNYTSLEDCMSFLRRLYEDSENVSNQEMLAIMKGQKVREKIPSQLPVGTIIVNKTGELDDVQNDIGIVFSENPYAIVVLMNDILDEEKAMQAIGKLAKDAYEIK